MPLTKYILGDLIEQRREKNNSLDVPIRGVSRDGFIDPKQEDADTSIYNVFYLNDFVFNPARMEVNSIALNTTFEKAICSSLYEIFYVKDVNILLPEYLNLYVKRDEFARICNFLSFGSAREYFRVVNFSQIELELPSIEIQQKAVDAYNAIKSNLAAYEEGIVDLKLTCQAYIEKLAKEYPLVEIGEYIESCLDKNTNEQYNIDSVKGISIQKCFIETKANMEEVSLKPYIIVEPLAFAFVPTTSRNGEKITIALNHTSETCVVSSSYEVFKVKDETLLIPEYLFLWLSRPEFDRFARYNSWGSAREVFTFSDMCKVKIPIPSFEVQRSIVDIFHAQHERQEVAESMSKKLKEICPVLISKSIAKG